MTAAIIDIGSNSVRLFLCAGWDEHGPVGERTTVITALRRGAKADGTLSQDALDRLDRCLADYAQRIASFAPDRVVPIATSATRDAPNRAAVVDVVQRRLGVPPEVLSGDDEAALAFSGARLAVAEGSQVTVLDVGGGSTEIVYGSGLYPDSATSLRVGSVRCTESHLPSDPPASAEMTALRTHVVNTVRPAIAGIPAGVSLVGVAGTVTTYVAIALGGYDAARVHGFRLSRHDLEGAVGRLAAMTLDERRVVSGLDPERAPVIVAGGIIVSETMRELGADHLLVSERDILDGVARKVLGKG